jgi:hypothetical protein
MSEKLRLIHDALLSPMNIVAATLEVAAVGSVLTHVCDVDV